MMTKECRIGKMVYAKRKFPPVPLKGRLRFEIVDNVVTVEVCDATTGQ
jgi:hypothetical protein